MLEVLARATALCVALLLFTAQPFAAAQMPDGPTIRQIRVEFEGVRNISLENIKAHMLLREGEPFSQTLADQSIRALYQSGNFEFIELRQLPAGDQIDVVFDVVPKYRIRTIRYEGNREVNKSDLEDEIESEPGMALDRVRINRDAVAMFEYLQKKGYSNASVRFEIQRDDTAGLGDVTFIIDEGQRYSINDIRFEGNEHFDEGDLEGVMETSEYIFLWSLIVGNGRLKEGELQDDLERLREHYKNAGYLDVEIPEGDVELLYPSDDELDIVIHITEGRRYFIGNIAFREAELFDSETLASAIELKNGDVFSPEKIDEAITALKDFYGQYGYLDTFIRIERNPNLETGVIDTTFVLNEGDRFHVESINIQGNTKTRSDVIVRELALAPGDVFDLVRMKVSEARLQNTRFFEEVKLSPEATNIPGRRNLRINVKEGQTGNLTFGAGFSSLESIVAFAEFQQSNFDLFNYRNYFQGGGQKFRVRASIGAESNSFVLAFEEPWVFQRRLAFGFELFRTQTDYLSADYNELRMGFEVYLRKRLFELVDGRLSYRLEQVDIEDVRTSAPAVIRQEAGTRSISKAGFSLSRDTRDRLLWTTRGNSLVASWDLAGLGGQTYYINQEYRATQYFLLFDDPFEQTIRLHGRTGVIAGWNDRSVPFFDRYFLGGPYTLRGYRFRDVGPQDPNTIDPIGGNTMAMLQLEYTIRFIEQLGLAAFYDGGFVNREAFDWDPDDYNDNWGVGARVNVMGAPLNLDFGFPLNHSGFNDRGMQFNFSFGTAF